MISLLKFLIFTQLVIALAFFSGIVTVDQLTDQLTDARRAVASLCTRVTASTFSLAQK